MTFNGLMVSVVNIGDGDSYGDSGFPRGIAIDENGFVYVKEGLNHTYRIQKLTNDLEFVVSWPTSSADFTNTQEGLAIDTQEYIYHANTGDDTVYKYSSDGALVAQWGGSGNGAGQFNVPSGIAIDQYNQVYVTDYDNNRVQKFTSEGIYISEWGGAGNGPGQFSGPKGIAIDSHGYLYVADVFNGYIQ